MGNQKLRWNSDEEKALFAGVEKYGTGKWKNILKDPLFAPFLVHRSNIDLKDKWRNLSVSAGQGSREKSRALTSKNNHVKTENSAPSSPNAAMDDDDLPSSPHDGNNAQRFNTMIFEAISTMRDPNGSDLGAICNFIEQSLEPPLPLDLRRFLASSLRRLVHQGKLEKQQNGYKIRTETPLGSPTETSTEEQKVSSLQQRHKSPPASSEQQTAADNVAYRIAEGESKWFLAAEAIKEADRIAKMEEEAEAMVELVKDIYVQCSEGEIIFLT